MIKNIEGFDDYYVCTDGVIYSTKKGHLNILKNKKYSHGYRGVCLCKEGKLHYLQVHRIVAKAFLNDYDESLQVNHKDCNKANNNLTNLEMVTQSQNMKHAYLNGLVKIPDNNGILSARSKLSEKDVIYIRNMLGKISYPKLAKQFNVSTSTIARVSRKKVYKNIP